jgi:tetratricopeptide (TPR) repeat protein
MFKRIRRALLLTKARSAELAGNFSLALSLLEQAGEIEPLRTLEQTLRATLLLRNADYQEAERELKRIAMNLVSANDPDRIYVRLYCEHVLATIEGDLDLQRSTRDHARRIGSRPLTRSWLPL